MPVQKLIRNNFSVFEDVEFDFCPGINVLIGKNATGKSHVMKTMYSLINSLPEIAYVLHITYPPKP